jgi:acyl carrier protein
MNVTAAEVRSFVLHTLDGQFAAVGIEPELVSDDFDLLDEGVIDSLVLLDLVVAVEEHFGLAVDFRGLDPDLIGTVGPLCLHFAACAERQVAVG